jgi:hypothetical protein
LNDDSYPTTEVVLPFTFRWLGEYNVTVVRVSTKGHINVDKDDSPSSRVLSPAEPIERDSTPSRISVAQGELAPEVGGTVYMLHVTSPEEALIISYEDVFLGSDDDEEYGADVVNAQAVLYVSPRDCIYWSLLCPPAFQSNI